MAISSIIFRHSEQITAERAYRRRHLLNGFQSRQILFHGRRAGDSIQFDRQILLSAVRTISCWILLERLHASHNLRDRLSRRCFRAWSPGFITRSFPFRTLSFVLASEDTHATIAASRHFGHRLLCPEPRCMIHARALIAHLSGGEVYCLSYCVFLFLSDIVSSGSYSARQRTIRMGELVVWSMKLNLLSNSQVRR